MYHRYINSMTILQIQLLKYAYYNIYNVFYIVNILM